MILQLVLVALLLRLVPVKKQLPATKGFQEKHGLGGLDTLYDLQKQRPPNTEVIKLRVNASLTLIFRQSISHQLRLHVPYQTLLLGAGTQCNAGDWLVRIVGLAAKYTCTGHPT